MIDQGKHAPLLGYIKGRPTTRKKHLIDTTIYTYKAMEVIIEGLRAKRAYISFWPIFTFCRIKLIFGRPTCFDMKSIVP